nr:MAG TPA: hypothetical protein [Caudoviricetes sp.]
MSYQYNTMDLYITTIPHERTSHTLHFFLTPQNVITHREPVGIPVR